MAKVEWLLLKADLVGRSVSQSSLMAEAKRTVADYQICFTRKYRPIVSLPKKRNLGWFIVAAFSTKLKWSPWTEATFLSWYLLVIPRSHGLPIRGFSMQMITSGDHLIDCNESKVCQLQPTQTGPPPCGFFLHLFDWQLAVVSRVSHFYCHHSHTVLLSDMPQWRNIRTVPVWGQSWYFRKCKNEPHLVAVQYISLPLITSSPIQLWFELVLYGWSYKPVQNQLKGLWFRKFCQYIWFHIN